MPESRLVPYIAAGFGGITLNPDNGNNDTSYLVNYGGGVKYFLTDIIALRGDLRHVISFDDSYNNLIYTLGVDFLFGGNKADIKPQYHGRLKEVADFMMAYPETKAVIEGHTDNVGSAAYNRKLSQLWAESVRNYLIQNFKISANRLTAKGFGEERPVASNDTDEGRRKNRCIQAVMSAETEMF